MKAKDDDKYIWTAKVGEKGQIVIPKEARDIFEISPGDTLLLLGDKKQGIAIVKNSHLLDFAKAILKVQEDVFGSAQQLTGFRFPLSRANCSLCSVKTAPAKLQQSGCFPVCSVRLRATRSSWAKVL